MRINIICQAWDSCIVTCSAEGAMLRPRLGVAQPGRARALGARGRRFESCRPDQRSSPAPWEAGRRTPPSKIALFEDVNRAGGAEPDDVGESDAGILDLAPASFPAQVGADFIDVCNARGPQRVALR